jgi:hypothetical protein
MDNQTKLTFIKTALKNPLFSGYLGRKGIAIDVITRRYTFPSDTLDKHIGTDYILINDYYARFQQNQVENLVKTKI